MQKDDLPKEGNRMPSDFEIVLKKYHGTEVHVTIPDGVTEIASNAFSDCTNLTSVTIPDSVTKIGNNAFYKCKSLTSVTIADGVTEIGDYAFEGCSKLKEVVIPCSLIKIGRGAFDSCIKLDSIVIPDSVTEIADGAFAFCSGVTFICGEGSYTQYYCLDNLRPYIKSLHRLFLPTKKSRMFSSAILIGTET